MSKINETNYPRRTQASYENTDMLVIQESGGNTYTTRIEDLREDCQETLAPTIDKINDALAPAENGATASQSYAIGEHFMRDGAFCTAIAAITSGGSFTLNTNYVVGTIADALSSLNSDLTPQSFSLTVDTAHFSMTGYKAVKMGKFIEIAGDIGVTDNAYKTSLNFSQCFNIPSGYRPSYGMVFNVIDTTNDKPINGTVATDGKVYINRDYTTSCSALRVHVLYMMD
jgi:hypothetical protein